MKEIIVIGSILVAIIITLLLAIIMPTLAIGNRLEFPGRQAQIEQLRSDVAKTNSVNNEDILGQVVDANMMIRKAQKYNSLWWADFAYPDGWNSIKIIEIPKSE